MEKRDLTVSQIGDDLKQTKVPIYQFLTKGRSIRIDKLEKLLEYFNLEVRAKR